MKDERWYSYRNTETPPKWLSNLGDIILYTVAFLLVGAVIFPLAVSFIKLF